MSIGGLLDAVEDRGFGRALGLRAGDRLLSVNGHELRDVIDLQFYGAESHVTAEVDRNGVRLHLAGERAEGQSWGLVFQEPLFDGLRTCANRCPFCFVSGLPPGLRPSLYVRDDDYRLSFLSGSFVTLTNLDESDWQRLAEQRLSPLHVSVQATDPSVRRRLLGGAPIPDICEQLARLGRLGIVVEAQVVVCPGLNDGAVLQRTVADLWSLRDTVQSVALVPVGLTRYQAARLRPVTSDLARELLAFASDWRRLALRRTGRRFLYPADELYLLAGEPVPGAAAYDGYPQLANGVGLVRRFLDAWAVQRRCLLRRARPQSRIARVALVTGVAMAPLLADIASALEAWSGVSVRVVAVENHFLGERITVAGLLTGGDVVEQAQSAPDELIVLPGVMFDAEGGRTLDGWRQEDLEEALGRPIAIAGTPADVIHILVGQGHV